jgi:hypothetical protein
MAAELAPRGMQVTIDSNSRGDPMRFRAAAELEAGLAALPSASRERGRVLLVVSRGEGGRRATPSRAQLLPDDGVLGDAWSRQKNRKVEAQIAVMEAGVAKLIANGQPLTLFGDNLFLELDLSGGNLPTGSRLRVGSALLEVTPKPHNGCRKFRERFGDDALHFVSRADLRSRNLRGIYLRVVETGMAAPGDLVEVISRGLSVELGPGGEESSIRPNA